MGELTMDYRRTLVRVAAVRSNHLLMVRDYAEQPEVAFWRLPAAELEEGEQPEDGAARALLQETGLEGKITTFLHREKPKGNKYRLILIYMAELIPTAGSAGYDPKEREIAPGALEVAWRSLRNPELREVYHPILIKAHQK